MHNRGNHLAYPHTTEVRSNQFGTAHIYHNKEGLMIREVYAMAAMQGLMSCATEHSLTVEQIATRSVEMADALLKALTEVR